MSLNFIPKGPINNVQSLVQIMAWRRPGDKPLSEPMMVSLLMHRCVTRPQRVNEIPKLATKRGPGSWRHVTLGQLLGIPDSYRESPETLGSPQATIINLYNKITKRFQTPNRPKN